MSMSKPPFLSAARSAIVDFEPGRSTSAVSAASADPGRSRTNSISGSASSGSRSSKLAICGRIGTATLTRPPLARAVSFAVSASASSAGSLRASSKCGTRPNARQPVWRAIVSMPSAKSDGSPRNRLTMKPRIRAASCGSTTCFVPTRLAMTPPRSMSPISTTGAFAARAKPILAMSLVRRLTSEALPAPSTSTMSAPARRRSKLSSTFGISPALIDW